MVNYGKHTIRFGLGTLDLRRTPDLVDTLNTTILTNAIRLPDGGWTSRFGQTALVSTTTSPMHSIVRADDPQSGVTNLFWGAGTQVWAGKTGALTSLSSGYSGNPVSLVPWQDAQSGQAWVIVGDSNKMVKVRVSDNLVLPIGLPIPASAPTSVLASENKKTIEDFESGFTGYAGTGAAPTLTYPAGKSSNCLQVVTATGASTGTYYNYADKTLNLDLSTYGGTSASDDDYIHLWLRWTNPLSAQEIRVYFVSTTFTAGVVPGTSSTQNQDGYFKTFRSSDASPIVQGATSVAAAPSIFSRRLTDDGVKTPLTQDEDFTGTLPDPATTTIDATSNAQTPSSEQVIGNFAWTEWGSVGIPLRRGDFTPFGENPTWASIKGIVVYAIVASGATTTIQFDECYLTGGAGPDTGEPGTQKYDYVCTNYDPRTAAESNTSTTQAEASWLDALRRGITVDPPAYGDAAVRQKFYRRGGTLVDDWRYVGMNSSDGGTFTDTLSDTELLSEETVPTDYFQAVPSVNASGAAVLAKPVPYVWGPLQGLVFAAGDPNRPGAVYYPYPNAVDHWSANGYANVASSSESIIGGFILGSQAFAWGTRRLYALNVNLSDSQVVTSTITNCTRAPIAPWAHVTSGGVNWFVASDGVYFTNGGQEQSITNDWVRPLFQGLSANGLAPVDYTQTTKLRLAVYQNELHFFYADTNGVRQSLVFHLLDGLWRHAAYAHAPNMAYADITTGTGRFLFGGVSGAGDVYGSTSDKGSAISVHLRTPASNEGYPKSLKRYSDFTMDIDRNGVDVTVIPYLNYDQSVDSAFTMSTGSGRQPYVHAFTPEPVLSPTLSLDVQWSTAAAPPVIYSATTTFEVEPPTITRWSSLPTDHGLPKWHLSTSLYLTLRSNASVTLSVTAYGQSGETLNATNYVLASTAGQKSKLYAPFVATKGVQYAYQLSSTEPFVLYPDSITATIQPWGAGEAFNAPIVGIANENSTGALTLTPEAAVTPGE